MAAIFFWLSEAIETEFEELRLLKESPRGSVRLIRHRQSGRRFILRRFTGNGEVYRKLLDCSCRHLPLIYEAAEQGEENLVIEEFIEGDTLGFLFRAPYSPPRRPVGSWGSWARPGGCSTPWPPSTGTSSRRT